MTSVQQFEEYECWQLARELTSAVYTQTRPQPMRQDFGFVDQIRRAAVSVMNNIAEGHERGSNKDFVKFLYIARASAGEVRTMLYVALDQEYIGREDFELLKDLAIRTSKACFGLIRYLSKNLTWTAKASLLFFLIMTPFVRASLP